MDLAAMLSATTENWDFMDYTLAVVALLAGLGAFLFGFKVLSDNIEKLATNKLRRWFEKTGRSRLAGVGIGAGVTAIIQSSSATTVMVVGFVNVGLMSLFQATTVIMGANIGTTVTAYFSVIADIPFIEIITVLTCVGIFMDMLCKKDKTKTIGMMLAGLGLVFLGLQYMGMAMDQFSEQQVVIDFLRSVDNRLVLLLAGIVITGIVQSSSAVTTLIVQMVGAGMVIGDPSNSGVLFLVLGTNIGTCVTALLSSIGAKTNAQPRGAHPPDVQRVRHGHLLGLPALLAGLFERHAGQLVRGRPRAADRPLPHLLQRGLHLHLPALRAACSSRFRPSSSASRRAAIPPRATPPSSTSGSSSPPRWPSTRRTRPPRAWRSCPWTRCAPPFTAS